MSKYGVFPGPYFPVFGLNTEIYSVNLRFQSEYRKIRTRNNSVIGHFSRIVKVDFQKGYHDKPLIYQCLGIDRIAATVNFKYSIEVKTLINIFLVLYQSVFTRNVLKYVLSCPNWLTCLTCLRAFMFLCGLRARIFFTCLICLRFFTCLKCLHVFMPSLFQFLTCLMCLHFFSKM